jgi:hypothetical protein
MAHLYKLVLMKTILPSQRPVSKALTVAMSTAIKEQNFGRAGMDSFKLSSIYYWQFLALKLGALVLAMFCVLTTGYAQSGIPVPPGCIAWWPGDNNARDVEGGNAGALMGGATFTNQAEVGPGFLFNGSSSYVQLPDNIFPYPTSGSGSQSFTFETWFQTSSNGVLVGQQDVAPFNNPNAGSAPGLYVGTDGKLYAQMFNGSSINPLASTNSVNDGFFHHAAVTYDGTSMTLYLDGVLVGSQVLPQAGYSSDYKYQLGTGYTAGWPGGNNGWFTFTGIIDEPALYNRALSPAEIQTIYTAGTSGKSKPPGASSPPGLVAWWPGDGDAEDMIGGNNGIMQPGATLAPGRAGQAFDFDGNGGRIQVVTPSASLNLRGALTIDAWIMPSTNAMSSEETIVRNGLNTDELYALYCSPQGALSFEWYDGSSFQEISSRTLLIPSNQWNYVTVTKTDTNTVHLYLNGREVAQGIATSPTSANPNTLCIGSSQPDHGGQDFQGLVDEVRIFNRTLSAGEIQTNYNNATGGDCDDSSVSSPSGLIGWWPGDGDASDLWSTNNGTLVNGATFAPGGIGECFSLSGSNYVQIGASPSLDMSNALSFSFEAWVYPTGPSGGTFVSKENEYAIGENANGMIQWRFANNNFNWAWYTNGFFIPTNQWTHVAVVYDQGTVYTYANARLVSKTPGSGPIENFAPGQNDFRIGARQQTGEYFQGLIDEVSIYNQALSMPEIQTIYYAGSSGKSKGAPCIRIQPLSQVTPAGTNVTLTIALTNGEVPAVIEPLGTNVTFTVEAAGMIPLTYQWFFGGTNLLGDFDAANLLVGQTNSSLQLTNVTWRNMGNYWIAVSNRFGPDISSPALLVVWDTNDDDHDGLPNYWEVRYGLNPTNASDAASYPPGDKLTYFQKYFYGLYDFNLPLTNDTDGDGISDYCELFEYGTNPFTNNTAGDGIPDGWKVAHGLNPMINDANDIVDGVSNWQIYQYDLTNTFQLNPSNPFFAPGTSIYEVLNNGQHTNHYYYDGNDRLLGMESSRGISIGYQYDGNGNLAPAICPFTHRETNGLPVLWLWLNALDQPAGNRLRNSSGNGWDNYQEWLAGSESEFEQCAEYLWPVGYQCRHTFTAIHALELCGGSWSVIWKWS